MKQTTHPKRTLKSKKYLFVKLAFIFSISLSALLLSGQEATCFLVDQTGQNSSGPGLTCVHTETYASDNNENYIPAPTDDILTYRVVVHIMLKADSTENFQQGDPDHDAYLDAMFTPPGGPNGPTVNECYANILPPEYQGPTGDPFVQDSRVRINVLNRYYHYDDVGWANNDSNLGSYCYDTYKC